ncbi:GNAT family N-acetyltransferase [Actinorugispora endophytica]|uniref:Acetyltransferase (GNAT) family protein n=1 Tax=Actinorugispora endophytica TaxID=1605990 RepID=A0A4R6UPJ6_9ACTN|nr:GNAT family N-acetyltransferase [Actinorugispora endophytica]TDQ48812.1 acetyltransferase (GNAT) family protein [Actinorugispora endophytica]
MGSSGAAKALSAVELVRLDGGGPGVRELREEVLRHRLGPGQSRFARPAAHTLPRADADPGRTPFAVVHEGRAVGFGILDRGGYLKEVADAPEESVLLRAFYIAPHWQGRGLGRAACAALPRLAGAVAPGATAVLLTVNRENHVARRAYLASGFADTGRVYSGGDAGPQDVLVRAVPDRRRARPGAEEGADRRGRVWSSGPPEAGAGTVPAGRGRTRSTEDEERSL